MCLEYDLFIVDLWCYFFLKFLEWDVNENIIICEIFGRN